LKSKGDHARACIDGSGKKIILEVSDTGERESKKEALGKFAFFYKEKGSESDSVAPSRSCVATGNIQVKSILGEGTTFKLIF
jgi:hypothetical protein